MRLLKPSFLIHLKALTTAQLRPTPPPSFIYLRLLTSFATPEDAAADRLSRKRRLRIEPPLLNSLRQSQPRPSQKPNPNAPKLPEHVSVLTGNRLNLHNRILKLIRDNDLDEASLLTCHSIYSNCRPTIFTCNSVMAAFLRQSRYSDLLSLHRFITQADVTPNIITHNLLINAYMDCRRTDTALEHYKQLIKDAPFSPSPTTYRILIKGLVDNNEVERALEMKDEMLSKGFAPDAIVYGHLMSGQAKNSNADGVFELYEELKEKLGGLVSDGVVCGSVMKGYFLKGMEKEAMECYNEALSEDSKIKMTAAAYNSVLDALNKNGKFDEALKLFERMMEEHNPPRRLAVNLGSFNVMIDGYCAEGRFKDAVAIFKNMGAKKCNPDKLSYNNLIEHLCNNGLLAEGEELYRGMSEKGVSPDESTYVLLMDACFKETRPDDAAGYYKTMVESKLRPSLRVYNKLIDGLVKAGKVDEAKSFFEMMVGKLKMNDESYKFMMKALFDVRKQDEVLKIVGAMLRDGASDFTAELQEFVREELRKEGREEDLVKLMEEIEWEKAEALARETEAAERAKASARAAISSLIPSRLFGTKETEEASPVATGDAVEATFAEIGSVNASLGAAVQEENSAGAEAKGDGTTEQT
ncbi:hypothetical protein LguiA_024188 [Lonicera macranthoides]